MATYYERNKERILARRKQKYHSMSLEEKQCYIKRTTKYCLEHKEMMREARKNWMSKTPTYVAYHNAFRRAKQLGLPFNIHYTDIIVPEVCPVLGIKLDRKTRETSPSLDRIIPDLGYVKGNISVISMRANRLKQDATLEELKALVSYLESS